LFYSDGKGGPSSKCPNLSPAGMCPWKSVGEAELHLNVVDQDLKSTNADIIMIEEVQDCVALQCVIEAMGDKTYKPYLIKGTDSSTMQNVGMISRVDPREPVFRSEARATIQSSSSYCGSVPDPSYNSGISKHVMGRFTINSIPIFILGVHFLSQPTNPSQCIKRECQASVARQLIAQEFLGTNSSEIASEVIVLGDFNDYDADVLDKNDNVPTSRVSTFIKYNVNNQQVLWNVADHVPRAERFSDWWDKNNLCYIRSEDLSMIDHIFVSRAIYDNLKVVKFWNSVDNSCGTYRSDHYAVQIDIDMNLNKKSREKIIHTKFI